jgi:uncharacterized protein YfkK (UPF0435 family)
VNTKEKLAIKLIILAVKILQPWKYEHQFTELLKDIDDTMAEKEGK